MKSEVEALIDAIDEFMTASDEHKVDKLRLACPEDLWDYLLEILQDGHEGCDIGDESGREDDLAEGRVDD